ncbi:MAG: phenylalanine--tRNA ligase subunit beta [Bacteroidota bacterium]
MKISYNWLKQFVDTALSPEEMGSILTSTGLEVEGIEALEMVKGGLLGVVVGEVLTCEKHPDADKLKVTTVNIGADTVQIVCGAPNVAAGQKVAVATVGTTLYPKPEEGFKIKVSKIRGVDSFGMLCAEDELGLGESHAGIMVLSPNLAVGTPLAEVLELENDYQFEIGLTPNRADAMGHIGVARDVIAYLNFHNQQNLALELPAVKTHAVAKSENVTVEVSDLDRCKRYVGQTVVGVKIEASPAWLQNKLRAVGVHPINNVVDATNYIMRELGTPLHAFDVRSLNGKIVVKTAENNSLLTTLDGVERKMTDQDLMITNGNDNLCIAGVFGGQDSGVKEDTKAIFIESAYFDPVSVRKTAKSQGLNTDASFRFERGVDPALTKYALQRAVDLIIEIAGGKVGMEIQDVYPTPVSNHQFTFNYQRCSKVIGTIISKAEINTILESLDITIVSQTETEAELSVPAYRVDVTREIDVIEEVLRIYGFNNVPLPEKLNTSIGVFPKPDIERLQDVVSEWLIGTSCSETLNNSLTKSSYVEKFGGEVLKMENNVEMLNPLSQDLDVLRQSMLFNTLEVIEHNQNRQNADLKLFEFGKTYHKYNEYVENKRLMISLTGRKQLESWNSSNDLHTFYSIKGLVVGLLDRLGLKGLIKEAALKKSLLEDGVQLHILKHKVGEIGWVSSKMRKEFGIKQEVFIADLDWDAIIACLQYAKIKYTELPKFFAVRRDFSLLLDKGISFQQIEELAKGADKNLLKEVGLFDVYEGKNLPEGKKSYAVSFIFQDEEKTLQDQQIDVVMNKIHAGLEEKLGAELRS